MFMNYLSEEINQFINFFLECFKLGYGNYLINNKLFNNENLKNFVVCEIFTENLNCLLMEVQRIIDKDNERDIQKKMSCASGILVERCGSRKSLSTDGTDLFNEAIEILKTIQFQSNPVHKLKVLVKAASLVKPASNELYMSLILNC